MAVEVFQTWPKWCLRKSKASEMVEEGSEHDEACEG